MKPLKNWDNKTWLSSHKYILSFYNFLKTKININKRTNILDIGCGRANIISFLQKKYKFKKKPVGIDIIRNRNLKNNITFFKLDAIKYFKKSNDKFDVILIKQTIHFFSKNNLEVLLNLAKNKLTDKGKILIFSLKTKKNEIPCFKKMKSNLINSLKKDEILIKQFKKNLKIIKKSEFKFKVEITRKKYIRMLKNRYISCLLNLSSKEIEKGIIEIKSIYKKNIKFNDVLNCYIYKN